MDNIYSTPTRITSSTLIYTGPGFLMSLLLGVDTVNDPVIAVYDALSAVVTSEIIPSTTYDASALGINGLMINFAKNFTTGLYVSIASLGSGSVVVDWRSKGNLFPNRFV